MSADRPGPVRRFFRGLWWLLDATRRTVVNLIFLLLLVIVLYAIFGERVAPLKDNTALVVAVRGDIVEQYSGGLADALVTQATGEPERETRLRDLIEALDVAATDPKIVRAVLLLDDMGNAGVPTLREVVAAIERFRKSGKQVVAWGASFDQRKYYIAAHADEVYLHPMGTVLLRGFGGWRNYYRDAMERVGVTATVVRAGAFKSFGEPFTAAGPSKEALEADTALYYDLWNTYTAAIEKQRKLAPNSVARVIDELPQRLAAVQGDWAQLALQSKLVDGIKTRDEFRALMIERGARDDSQETFRQIHFLPYLSHAPAEPTGDRVGVVVVEGELVEGESGPGLAGGRSIAETLRKAREDRQIKAIVLRVNSPGGSPYGSELIRRELELTRAAGKPVVVSMGDVAASGGYWVSLAADEVFADAATITGSIGVIALLPSFDKAMDKLSIRTGGVQTAWLAGAMDPRRPLDKRLVEVVQSSVDHNYQQFLTLAAAARKTAPAQIDPVAQGRVWTGRQAKERNLIDTLGGLQQAIGSARKRANLGEDAPFSYLERGPGRFDWLLSWLVGRVSAAVGTQVPISPQWLWSKAAPQVSRDFAWLRQVGQADGPVIAAHCLCRQP